MIKKNILEKKYLVLCIALIMLLAKKVESRPLPDELDKLSAEEMAALALQDSLYYNFEEWFVRFQLEINRLESAPPILENRIELMKHYFNYSGLLGELTHTLSFTSTYQIEEISKRFLFYSNRVKDLAYEIRNEDAKSLDQEAQAKFFLGAVEGYMGIFEYGQGNLFEALVNGFRADNHLEEALRQKPELLDGYLGLGMYRYGNSRLGGIGNFIMQGGKDLRQVGLNHIQYAILKGAPALPLAMKTLVWFYISEQINPKNKDLSTEHPLSKTKTRQKAWSLLIELENRYFKGPAPHPHFIGNKEIAMMKALQYVLDKKYNEAGIELKKVLKIARHLKKRGFEINPQLISSVDAGIKFCELMLWGKKNDPITNCFNLKEQIDFLRGGGSMIEYDSKKIRSELDAVFYLALEELRAKMDC